MPVKKEVPTSPPVELTPDFKQNIQQIIYTWQDKHMTDSLLPYFTNDSEILRYLAVRAFGSIKDNSALPGLFVALKDSSIAVKAAAAYAIGQIGDIRGEKPLTDAFINYDSVPGFDQLNAIIMEAIGKCGSAASLKLLSEVTTFLPTDTFLLLGQSRAIYRFSLRNITHPSGTECMVKIVTRSTIPENVRMVAANYLHRTGGIDLKPYAEVLSNQFEAEKDINIKMCLITAVVKSDPLNSPILLRKLLNDPEEDYRTLINAIKSMKFISYTAAEGMIVEHLKSKQPLTTWQAAQFLIENGMPDKGLFYYALVDSTDINHWETRLTLLGAAALYTPVSFKSELQSIASTLENEFNTSTLPARKRLAVLNMGNSTYSLVPLKEILENEQQDIIYRTAAAEALGKIVLHPYFEASYQGASTEVKHFIAKYLSIAAKSSEEGLTAAAAKSIVNPKAALRMFVSDTINWQNALNNLKLPKQTEDYIELLKLQKYLSGELTDIEWQPDYNHPIQWDILRNLSDTLRMHIKTTYGDIQIRMLKNHAPATVLSFYTLVKEGYYNGKTFHRVVPNFVIQGGCTRGDGYGSLDFSLRSELPPVYYDREGYLGMASSGSHTESQQFFITHSPTPHLDGQYTIFGKVESGMDIVHNIRPGDLIDSIEIVE